MSAQAEVGPRSDARPPGPEWWEQLSTRWHAWQQHHEVGFARWRRISAIALWVALAGLIVVFVAFPEFRAGMRIWLWLYLLLVAWFLVARTKTVSWRLVAGMFAVAVPWALAIAVISSWLSSRIGEGDLALEAAGQAVGFVNLDGNGTAIAGFAEESLKLVPLAALAIAAPGLVRRFAVVDWLLLGFAAGLAFQAFEELARRTAQDVVELGPVAEAWEMLLQFGRDDPHGPGSGFAQYGLSLLAGRASSDLTGAAWAGHHIMTGLVATSVGLGIAAWRRASRLTAASRVGAGWRVAAVAVPVGAWWLAVCDHFGYNAASATAGRLWIESDMASTPWVIRVTWDWFGRGFGRGWLLLGLLVLAMLVDARHLRRGERNMADTWPPRPPGSPNALAWTPGLVADGWTARLAARLGLSAAPSAAASAPSWRRRLRAAVASGCALVAYTTRDVVVTIAASARRPDESRREAMAAGRLAMMFTRDTRAALIESAAPAYGRLRRWPGRIAAALGLAFLAAGALLVAPAVADQVGTNLQFGWLAGLLDYLADWWNSLGWHEQLLVIATATAVLTVFGAPLWPAVYGVGGAAFFVERGRGGADFIRNPAQATRSYFANNPWQVIVGDVALSLITFLPPAYGAGRFGQSINVTVRRTLPPPRMMSAYERHIFYGQISAKGKATGFHYQGGIGHRGHARVVEITVPRNAQGVYRARVEVWNPQTSTWVPKKAESTFFPDDWTWRQVRSEIDDAFRNRVLMGNDQWHGVSPSGMRIDGFLDSTGNSWSTAWPGP